MRVLTIAAAAIALVVDAFYLGIVLSQPGPGDGLFLRVPFVAAFIALMAAAAVLSLRSSAAGARPALLALSGTGLFVVGYFALFSIGLPVLVAGILALIACVLSTRRDWRPARSLQTLAGFVVALVVVVGGFEITDRAIQCPPTGFLSGSSPGLFGFDASHYTCANGALTIRSGACNSSGGTVDSSGKVIAVSGC